MRRSTSIIILFACCAMVPRSPGADVVLVKGGVSKSTIHAPSRVVGIPDQPHSEKTGLNPSVGTDLQRLHESVRDLSHYLNKISGTEVPVVAGAQDSTATGVPILIGELATEVFGPPHKTTTYKQGFRVVISPRGVGLIGESDLAVSYAIYELLDRLGCRWFMPSEMGECIPKMATIAFPETDFSSAPGTMYRGIWQADADFKRRNRLGGFRLNTAHALDSYLRGKPLEEHPDWVAVINGKPAPPAVKWTRPEVAEAMADAIIAQIDKTGQKSVSLSPEDGLFVFDESEDPKFDAGDFDPVMNMVSITDRLMILCNRVAERVTAKYPETLFGVNAYVQYTRPPVREKVHPSIVPVIAPIIYSRVHPVTFDQVPNNKLLREAVDGWGDAAHMIGWYGYVWNLADMAAPHPMITKQSIDLPYLLQRNLKFYQPETTSNFETTLHGLYLGMRLAWDPSLDPEAVVDDINTRFYGQAAEPMAAYWRFVDELWIQTPDYAGGAFGFMRRFPPETVKKMRELLNAGIRAAHTPEEQFRVQMANDSLILFERYMKLRVDLAEGRFARLDADADRYVGRMHAMAERYRQQYAFAARWYGANGVWGSNNDVDNFNAFYHPAYDDAARIARFYEILTPEPLREWRYAPDKDNRGETLNWNEPAFDDSAWKVTDVAVDTWSALGYHNYFGPMWYRAAVQIPTNAIGHRTFVWFSATDGHTKLFVNGKHIPYVDDKGTSHDRHSGAFRPVSFDITKAVAAGENHLVVQCERTDLNEIGTGGLMGPVVIYVIPCRQPGEAFE